MKQEDRDLRHTSHKKEFSLVQHINNGYHALLLVLVFVIITRLDTIIFKWVRNSVIVCWLLIKLTTCYNKNLNGAEYYSRLSQHDLSGRKYFVTGVVVERQSYYGCNCMQFRENKLLLLLSFFCFFFISGGLE